jgi:two-component system cit operon sensor histidine kinase CitA
MPLSSYAVQRYAAKDQKTGKSLQYHIRQRATQKLAINILREERHEFINELTLISTYLQMGKYAEAKTCLDYSSAKLADRNNYPALPHDAWLTVLELKQREAKHRQIDFRVDIRAKAPASFQEQRLLPKLIINLVDNAFHAVARQPDAQVSLSWSLGQDDERILRVSNNGPEVSPWDGKMIFRGGVTTKQEDSGNHGWGLVICKDIAGVLHGSLTYQSSPERTTFALTLPPAEQEVYEGLLEASF